jgi:hypothetical protein
MNSAIRNAERMSLDDLEELLFNRPEDEKWELIDDVLVKGMVGARVEHHIIIDNIGYALRSHFERAAKIPTTFNPALTLSRSLEGRLALPLRSASTIDGSLFTHLASSFRPRRMSFAVSATSPSSRIAAATAAEACPG